MTVETVRLTIKEQEELRDKCLELNEQLIRKGQQPIKISQLVHIILEHATDKVKLTEEGKPTIEK